MPRQLVWQQNRRIISTEVQKYKLKNWKLAFTRNLSRAFVGSVFFCPLTFLFAVNGPDLFYIVN